MQPCGLLVYPSSFSTLSPSHTLICKAEPNQEVRDASLKTLSKWIYKLHPSRFIKMFAKSHFQVSVSCRAEDWTGVLQLAIHNRGSMPKIKKNHTRSFYIG